MSMAIFNSYVCLPEGGRFTSKKWWVANKKRPGGFSITWVADLGILPWCGEANH